MIAAARGRSWRFWTLVAGVGAAALATALSLVFVAPWESSGDSGIQHALISFKRADPSGPFPYRIDRGTG